MRRFIILLSLVGAAYSIIPELKYVFNYNPSKPNQADTKPRLVEDAVRLGYNKIRDCKEHPKFNGFAYTINNDNSVVLLYNQNGLIIGIQLSVPKMSLYPNLTLPAPFVKDGDNWMITFYFEDPALACTADRPKNMGPDFKVFLQISDVATSNLPIPRLEKDIDPSKWAKGICIPGIGQHYWLTLGGDSSCEIKIIVSIIYHQGQIVGFSFGVVSTLQFPVSGQIPKSIINMLLGLVPPCLKSGNVVDEIYVFITPKPLPQLTC